MVLFEAEDGVKRVRETLWAAFEDADNCEKDCRYGYEDSSAC